MILMTRFFILIAILGLSSVYGIWFNKNQGKMKEHTSGALSEAELGSPLGSRVTLVQFSSAFCMPCKATRVLLQEISQGLPDVVHIDIDAESHLDLVRKLNILSTPTTLILDSHGIELGRAVGAPKREQVLDAIAPISI
jgi:thiol-disulfide isomerase/thioredoxin